MPAAQVNAPTRQMMLSEDALAQALAGRGYKLTRPRRAVLRVIARATTSLSPAEIFALARKVYPRTGLVTVYRTLEVLTERSEEHTSELQSQSNLVCRL